MWVIGGYDATAMKNDVWSSADGVTWAQATAAAPFSARSGMQAIILNNQLCVIAGNDGNAQHDTWCSSDGAKWSLAARVNVQF